MIEEKEYVRTIEKVDDCLAFLWTLELAEESVLLLSVLVEQFVPPCNLDGHHLVRF